MSSDTDELGKVWTGDRLSQVGEELGRGMEQKTGGRKDRRTALARNTSLLSFVITKCLGGGESRILSGADKLGTVCPSPLPPRGRCHLAAQLPSPSKDPLSPVPSSSQGSHV